MARSLNRVMLIGNLGRDPELKALASGSHVVTFSIATSRKWKDKNGEMQEETQWHNIVAWDPRAETLATYLKKGSRVYIEGRLTHRSWDDQNGQKRYTTEVVVENYLFLDGAPDGARTGRAPIPPPPEPPDSAPVGGEEEDVPF